jgi:hypothetical protein
MATTPLARRMGPVDRVSYLYKSSYGLVSGYAKVSPYKKQRDYTILSYYTS